MNATASALGPYRLGEALSPGAATSSRFEWRRAERDGSADLVAKVAKDATSSASLLVEARRVVSLRDRAPDALAPLVDIVQEGGVTALVFARAPGHALLGAPLDEARALALAARLARFVQALAASGLSHPLDAGDLIFDPASAQLTVTGLSRLRPAAGMDPRVAVVAWGEVLARVLGTPRTPRGYRLEALYASEGREPPRPATVALVRDALAGDEGALDRALEGAARHDGGVLRGLARSGLSATIVGPLVYHVFDADPPSEGIATLRALCARTGSLVVVRTADARGDFRAARSRVEEEFDRARAERAPLRTPLLRFRATAIDPARARAMAPEVRREEAFAVYAWGDAAPVPVLARPLALGRFEVARDGDRARFTIDAGAATRVLVVSGPSSEPLVAPEDGTRVAELEGDALRAPLEAPLAGRWAAFPLSEHEAGVPSYASLEPVVEELARFEGEPGVGRVAFAWSLPPGSIVHVRTSREREPGTPLEGELAYWGRRLSRIEVPAAAGETVFARAFIYRENGTFSRGRGARAESWSPPEAVTAFAADSSAERSVKLSWQWPRERARIQAALLRRDPAPPGGAVPIDPQGPPTFEDRSPPLGAIVKYELAVVSGGIEATAEATALPWAELAAFKAEGAGEAVALSWSLPEGASPDVQPRIVRRLDRAPADLDDGDLVPVFGGTEQLDAGLAAGTLVHYRAGLVFASGLQRSQGLVASAAVLEKAGALADLVVTPKKKALEVRWAEPRERVDDVVLYAGPEGRDRRDYDRAAYLAGKPVRLDAAPGVPQRVRVVPRLKGREDASGALVVLGSAWDEIENVVARPGPGSVELAWSVPPPGCEVVVKRRLDVKDAPWEELKVLEGSTTSFRDEPPRGKGCVYKVALRFRTQDQSIESDGVERREQSRELPPELGSPAPRVRQAPGQLGVVYFEPKAKINYSGVVVYESPRSPQEVQAAFKALGREHHVAEDLPLGVDLVEVAQKDKSPTPKVEVAIDVREPGARATTLVLATRNGPVRRLIAVLRALRLPAGVLSLRATTDEKSGKPRLDWTLPGATGARLARVELRRALNDPDQELPPKERERLEAPFVQALAEGATSFTDASADDGVTFAYTLAATFEDGPERFEVSSAPASVRGGKPGGKLLVAAAQARGVFGFKKPPSIELTVKREGGQGAWPAFQIVRTLEGAKGEVAVASFEGGETPPGAFRDDDLAAFSAGMTLGYALKLSRYLDARRVELGAPAKAKLG